MNTDLGKITKEADGYKVRFERVFEHNIETVWDAITNPGKLKYWFTDFEMEFRAGGKLAIIFRDEAKTKTYGEIVAIEKPHKFVYTWEDELAVWELQKLGDKKTGLTLTYSKLGDEYAIGASAGFHTLLERLEKMLGGDSTVYPFGTEGHSAEHEEMKVRYFETVLKVYPKLEKYVPIVVERTYNAPVANVWQAITDKDQMKQWYFDLTEFRPEEGFEFQFYGQGHKGEQYLHVCKITEVVPRQRLQYSWRYEGYEGNSFVTFELFEEGDKTRVRLTHTGLHTFPADNPDFAKSSFNQGWTELIGKYLKEFVENPN